MFGSKKLSASSFNNPFVYGADLSKSLLSKQDIISLQSSGSIKDFTRIIWSDKSRTNLSSPISFSIGSIFLEIFKDITLH